MKISLIIAACIVIPWGALSAADPDVRAFRRDLADQGKNRLRMGLKLDLEGLQRTINGYYLENADALSARLERSVRALPEKKATQGLRTVAVIEGEELGPAMLNGRIMQIMYDGIIPVSRVSLSMTLPMVMSRLMGMSIQLVGAWLGFLAVAEPEWSRLEMTESGWTIEASYGGQDIFVFRYLKIGKEWQITSIKWLQGGIPELKE